MDLAIRLSVHPKLSTAVLIPTIGVTMLGRRVLVLGADEVPIEATGASRLLSVGVLITSQRAFQGVESLSRVGRCRSLLVLLL